MNGLEALKAIRPCANVCGDYDPYCDIIEKELMLFRSMLKIAISDESDREFIENATEEDIKEAYRNAEFPKKEELSADDWVKLFGIAKEAIGGNQKEVDAETKGIADAKQDFNEDELKMLKMIFKGTEAALEAKREGRYDVYDINVLYSLKEKLGIADLLL